MKPRTPLRPTVGVALPIATVAAALLHAPAAAAQPSGIAKEKTVTGGTTDVATEGFQAAADPPAEKATDAVTLKLMAGGLLTTGNTKSVLLTGAADFLLRREASELRARAAVNTARTAESPDDDLETTVENYQGNLRYNYFVSDALSAFLSLSARKDKFQSLVLRLNVDPGFAYYLYDEKDLQLWAELGYDLQHDIREDDAVDAAAVDPEVEDIGKTETRHGARAMLGYIQQLSPNVGVDSWVEYIQALNDTKFYRINASAALTSQLAGALSLATSVTMRYDAAPLEGVESTDVVVAFNLVYTLK